MLLHKKNIIVTGAGGALGRAMTLGLLRAGANVIATDVRAANFASLEEAAFAMQGGALKCIELDLCPDGNAERLVAAAQHAFGPVFALINNAGLTPGGFNHDFLKTPPKSWEVDPTTWRRFFSVNADALFLVSRAVVPAMLSCGVGRIINVTTGLPVMLRSGLTPYGPSKAAAESLSAIMAAELGETGVTVNVLVPGGQVDTENVPVQSETKRQRLLKPTVMVAPLLWLLSDEAANFTGARINAAQWKTDVPAALACEAAAAAIGWTGLPREKNAKS